VRFQKQNRQVSEDVDKNKTLFVAARNAQSINDMGQHRVGDGVRFGGEGLAVGEIGVVSSVGLKQG
jgi:hypothetical protein